MWIASVSTLDEGRGFLGTFQRDGRSATFDDVIQALRCDQSFRGTFNQVLADMPFASFRWETPAYCSPSKRHPFEFVVLDSPSLDRIPDPQAFGDCFSAAVNDVAVFTNLGGDAELVVPCPIADPTAYGHLAAFVRHAPAAQQDALWKAVGDAMAKRNGEKPVWLSTAGAGVAWLHVRLDDRPKYYGYAPYRTAPRT